VRAPLAEVRDARRSPVRMEARAQDVEGRGQQLGRDALGEERHGAVRGQHLPGAVDHQGRIGLVARKDQLERVAHGRHLRVVERVLLVDGRVTRRQQQSVAIAQGDVKLLGQGEDEAGAGARAARLDEAQVPGGHAGVEREVELAEAPAPAPVADERSDPDAGCGRHRADTSAATEVPRLPPR
jgi:hypothetical protein